MLFQIRWPREATARCKCPILCACSAHASFNKQALHFLNYYQKNGRRAAPVLGPCYCLHEGRGEQKRNPIWACFCPHPQGGGRVAMVPVNLKTLKLTPQISEGKTRIVNDTSNSPTVLETEICRPFLHRRPKSIFVIHCCCHLVVRSST